MPNSRFESEALRQLKDIASSARQMGNALVAMGRMFQDYMGVDIAAIQESTKRLNDLARQMEQAQPGPSNKYAADADGKMKIHEWMHNLNAHYELVDPNGAFHEDQVTKDEFWAYIEMLAENKMVRRIKPEPVKDPDQLEIPQLIGEWVVVQDNTEPFTDGDHVQVVDKIDENYLRVGTVDGVDNTTKRARVRFPDTSEGVLVNVFDFRQLMIMPEIPDQPHNNISHCSAAGCGGECGEKEPDAQAGD